jgi:hypothetical protein
MARRLRSLAAVVAVCLLIPLTGEAQTTTPAPRACVHCAECSGDADVPRVVRVRVYNQSQLSDASVTALLDLAGRIWLPSGIAIEPVNSPGAVTIVVTPGEHPGIAGEGRTVLGVTLFSDHHATPYIRVWVGAAEAVAAITPTGSTPFVLLPRERREAILVNMLGVALAHELGHYLLDSAQHSRRGILRGGLRAHDLVEADLRLELTPAQRQTICRAAGKQSTPPDLSR